MKKSNTLYFLIFIIILSLAGCSVVKTSSRNDDKTINNVESNTNDKIEITSEENEETSSINNSTETKDQVVIPDLPDDFIKCTKYIGKDISTLGIDVNLWDFDSAMQKVGKSSLYGHAGIVSMDLGWDDRTITDIVMLFDDDEHIQGDEYKEISNKLESIFGDAHLVMDGINDFYGKTDCAFRLLRNGAGIGWNGKNREEFDKLEPSTEESTTTEAPKVLPQIGMTAEEVEKSLWGKPSHINKTTTRYGVSEQWVYRSSIKSRYIYFKNGVVTAIQE